MICLRSMCLVVGRLDRGHELPERVDGRRPGGALVEYPLQVVEEARLLAQEDVLLALEVGEDRARRDVGGLGDVGQRRVVVPALGEQLERHPLDRVARLLLLAFPQANLGRRGRLRGSYGCSLSAKPSQDEILQ